MKPKRFIAPLAFLSLATVVCEGSPITWNVGPDSEYLEKFGIEIECRPDNFRDGQPLSFPFRIRVSKQEPIEGKPGFFGGVTCYDTAEKKDSVVAVQYRGSATEGFEANFRVDAKKLGQVTFGLSFLVEHIRLELDLEAFAKAAVKQRQERKR